MSLTSIFAAVAQAANERPGDSCRLGDRKHVVVATGINLDLTCKNVSGRAIYVNDLGNLHAGVYFVPIAISGQPFQIKVPILGGTPGYGCAIGAGTGLPNGFQLALGGQILNGIYYCVITSMPVPPLDAGTSKLETPPFALVFTDHSKKVQRVSLKLQITIVAKGPKIIVQGATCVVNQSCTPVIATATGGTPPYHFVSDTFRNGAPPMGVVVGINGSLTGRASRAGLFTFGVCVVDSNGAQDCSPAQLRITPAPSPTPTPTKTALEKALVKIATAACVVTKTPGFTSTSTSGVITFTIKGTGTISGPVGTKITFSVYMPEGYSSPQKDQVTMDGWNQLDRSDILANYASNFERGSTSPSPTNWTFTQDIVGRWDTQFPSASDGRYDTGMKVAVEFNAESQSPNEYGNFDYQQTKQDLVCAVP